jgi:hypothetical protein
MWSQAPDVERARRKGAGEGVKHQGLADRPSISSSPVRGRSGNPPRDRDRYGAISKPGTAGHRAGRDGKSPRPRQGGGRSRQAKASPAKRTTVPHMGASGKNSPAGREMVRGAWRQARGCMYVARPRQMGRLTTTLARNLAAGSRSAPSVDSASGTPGSAARDSRTNGAPGGSPPKRESLTWGIRLQA